jgi:hypothetical protein
VAFILSHDREARKAGRLCFAAGPGIKLGLCSKRAAEKDSEENAVILPSGR